MAYPDFSNVAREVYGKELKQNISILIYSLASGGAERVVSILLEELGITYDVTLVIMNPTIHYDLPKNQKVIYLESSSPQENGFIKLIKLPFLGLKYRRLCKKHRIDVSLSFLNRPNYIAIFSKLFANRSKIIINERSMPSLQHKYGLQGWINRHLIKTLYPKADVILTNSLGNALDLQKYFKLSDVSTFHNPFDFSILQKYSSLPVKNNDLFTFISVGRLDHGKNHKLIIDAIHSMDARLLILGDGILRSNLEQYIRQSNLSEKVFLIGLQQNPFEYLQQADCFVFSSNHEGFPNVLVEALACNLPVISTDCDSGPREILAPNTDPFKRLTDEIELSEFGILTPTNDVKNLECAMRLIQNDATIRYNYKHKSIQRAESFEKSKQTHQLIELIESL